MTCEGLRRCCRKIRNFGSPIDPALAENSLGPRPRDLRTKTRSPEPARCYEASSPKDSLGTAIRMMYHRLERRFRENVINLRHDVCVLNGKERGCGARRPNEAQKLGISSRVARFVLRATLVIRLVKER